jgi:NAD+ synthase
MEKRLMGEITPKKLIDNLNINPESASAIVKEFILNKYKEQGADGIVLGLSGGLDSAVVTSIVAQIINPTRVYALHLFDRDSQPRFLEYAKKLSHTLSINFEARDITELVDELVGQKRAVGSASKPLWRLRHKSLSRSISRRIYYFTRKGYPFILALRRLGIDLPLSVKRLYGRLVSPTTSGFGPKHIVRRQVLEKYAAEKNLLLIGAANRSEALTGWFVEGGVDDLPIEPIMGLYKHQVYHLAHFLKVPSEIIEEPPSPDFMPGMTDESMFGLPWEKIDRVLYVLENGFNKKVALEEGITPVEFDKVWIRYLDAEKKRGDRHEYPII